MRRSARTEQHVALAREWRRLGRAATIVALLTSPAVFAWLTAVQGWNALLALVVSLALVALFRGFIDVLAHRFIPRPSLYGADAEARARDAVDRRRVWYWRAKFRRWTWLIIIVGGFFCFLWFAMNLFDGPVGAGDVLTRIGDFFADPAMITQVISLGIMLPLLFLVNFLIFFGPLLAFGVMQMKGYEPGDADWGVKLDDVRGQAEPKEEITRVIQLWQSGEDFRKAGGKPERGLLFIGAPGTGKTMLSKAIATSFNSPICTMPGSGFAQTFIGLDVVIVMLLIRKARRLARKWGGQCIIFIDEIDAIGRRRQNVGGAAFNLPVGPAGVPALETTEFFGPWGARNPSEDLVLETREWRERLFAARAAEARVPGIAERIQTMIFPGMGMGMMALNQLLVQMDGMDEPPFFRKFWVKKFNTFLDALYFVPQRIGKVRLRFKPAKPRGEQVYFIGATNVNLDALDPALIRPGRMGRHIHFRTPTRKDRADIFDLYLGKVSHLPTLDGEEARDELSRMTNGYSPAMIEQVCSMALTFAHSDGRDAFDRTDIVEAMTTIESGTAIGVDYVQGETHAVAIHEAGHAVASHVYMRDTLSTRLSIKMRGSSLGHHQAIQEEERFSSWRHEEVGQLVWTLGAMAAEHVFYGENSVGVGGDLHMATAQAARMVGFCGMGPEPLQLNGRYETAEERHAAEEEYMQRFERIGMLVMNRAQGSSMMSDNPYAAILKDPIKKAAAARILGQAYLTALCAIRHNRDKVANVAATLVERKELHGNEVTGLLEAQRLEAPVIDVTDDAIWPRV
jgi:ATP-dependent Zn protease